MNLHAWGQQRTQYSRARRGRNERGATLVECALVQGVTQAMAIRLAPRPVVEYAAGAEAAEENAAA